METTRIKTTPLSGSERLTILSTGYIEVSDSPDPDWAKHLSVSMRVIDVGPDWIDVER